MAGEFGLIHRLYHFASEESWSLCAVSRSRLIARARNSNCVGLRLLGRRRCGLVIQVKRGVGRIVLEPHRALLWLAEHQANELTNDLLHIRRGGDDDALIFDLGFEYGGLDVLQERG